MAGRGLTFRRSRLVVAADKTLTGGPRKRMCLLSFCLFSKLRASLACLPPLPSLFSNCTQGSQTIRRSCRFQSGSECVSTVVDAGLSVAPRAGGSRRGRQTLDPGGPGLEAVTPRFLPQSPHVGNEATAGDGTQRVAPVWPALTAWQVGALGPPDVPGGSWTRGWSWEGGRRAQRGCRAVLTGPQQSSVGDERARGLSRAGQLCGHLGPCWASADSVSSLKRRKERSLNISSAQVSHSGVSDSLRPHGLQHARPPCPSPAPRVYPNSCPLSQ